VDGRLQQGCNACLRNTNKSYCAQDKTYGPAAAATTTIKKQIKATDKTTTVAFDSKMCE
jgi:hypothetical protein